MTNTKVLALSLMILTLFQGSLASQNSERGIYCKDGTISCSTKLYLGDLFPDNPRVNNTNSYLCSGDQTYTCTNTKENNGQCFPGSVSLQGRNSAIRMDNLKVGDVVQTPSGYEPVLGWIRRDSNKTMDVLTLVLVCNNRFTTLHLSPDHFIYQNVGNGSVYKYVKAKYLYKGATVMDEDGNCRVSDLFTRFGMKGVYSPLVASGELYVNGIKTSCYSTYLTHDLTHIVMKLKYYLGYVHSKDTDYIPW